MYRYQSPILWLARDSRKCANICISTTIMHWFWPTRLDTISYIDYDHIFDKTCSQGSAIDLIAPVISRMVLLRWVSTIRTWWLLHHTGEQYSATANILMPAKIVSASAPPRRMMLFLDFSMANVFSKCFWYMLMIGQEWCPNILGGSYMVPQFLQSSPILYHLHLQCKWYVVTSVFAGFALSLRFR